MRRAQVSVNQFSEISTHSCKLSMTKALMVVWTFSPLVLVSVMCSLALPNTVAVGSSLVVATLNLAEDGVSVGRSAFGICSKVAWLMQQCVEPLSKMTEVWMIVGLLVGEGSVALRVARRIGVLPAVWFVLRVMMGGGGWCSFGSSLPSVFPPLY